MTRIALTRTATAQGIAWIAAAALLALTACGGKDETPSPPPQTAVAQDTTPPRLQSGDPGCPANGKWKACDLFDRLTRMGVGPKVLDESTHVAFLDEPGIQYKIGSRALLIVFFYPDSVALAKALAPLDTLRLVPKGDTAMPWPEPPTVIRSANVVAAFFGTNAAQIERVVNGITGGAPQGRTQTP